MSRLFSHPEALVNSVKRIAVEAGDVTLRYFDESGYQGAQEKADGSPVTQADREAEKFITQALRDISADVPIIGEESFADGTAPDLSSHDLYWMVDPLDGTREFIAGGEDYTVNIALIEKGSPVMGVVMAPVRGEVYMAHRDVGAARWLMDTDTMKPISVRPVPREGYTAIVSKHRGHTPAMNAYLERFKIAKTIARGSSLKICAVATGKADIYPNIGTTCEWDLAAGHAILKAAGGNIFDMQGQELSYGHVNRGFKNPDFVAMVEFPDMSD